MIRRYYNAEVSTISRGTDDPIIEGVSTLFDVESPNWEGFIEVVHKGFFDDVVDDDVVALLEHDGKYPLAGVRNNTLVLNIDDVGVTYSFVPSSTSYSRDLLSNVRSGLINQSSFSFSVTGDGQQWEELPDGTIKRHLIKAERWFDVSPVTHAYYPETTVVTKNIKQEYSEFLATRQKTSYHDWIGLELDLLKLN